MFTGIVEELGHVRDVTPGEASARLTLTGPLVTSDATHGASIAVNGVCLTVVEHDAGTGWFTVDVMAETLSRSGLGDLAPGDPVNLEVDVIAKHVEKLLLSGVRPVGATEETP